MPPRSATHPGAKNQERTDRERTESALTENALADAHQAAAAAVPVELPPPQPGDIGRAAPSVFVATSPTGHWAVLCQAIDDTDGNGKLEVRLSQHGEFVGDTLLPGLFIGSKHSLIDEFAGSDPSGRWLAYADSGKLTLVDTLNDKSLALEDADLRASQASFMPLRGVSFSDDGKYVAYIRRQGTADDETNTIVLRELETASETTISPAPGLLERIHFAAGGRYLLAEIVTTDTNKNRRLQWRHPQRNGPARCPSPVPSYNVWQYPGDTPQTHLLDTQSGKTYAPEGFAVAAGNVYVRRSDDNRLLAYEPDKPTRLVSSEQCLGRVLHVDVRSGNVVYGCAPAWGQRRDIFLRTETSRKKLNFDLAGFELDARLDTPEPSLAFYPRNESLIFNVRTQERWPLKDGTQVIAIDGTTALIERSGNMSMVQLNPDASVRTLTKTVSRPAFATIVRQENWVSVGVELFDLKQRRYVGAFQAERAPLSLSRSGAGLFPAVWATPASVGLGPFRWMQVK